MQQRKSALLHPVSVSVTVSYVCGDVTLWVAVDNVLEYCGIAVMIVLHKFCPDWFNLLYAHDSSWPAYGTVLKDRWYAYLHGLFCRWCGSLFCLSVEKTHWKFLSFDNTDGDWPLSALSINYWCIHCWCYSYQACHSVDSYISQSLFKQELIRRWDSKRELLRSVPRSYPNSLT